MELKDAQAELLQLYRDNYSLREDKQLAAEQATRSAAEIQSLRAENARLREQKVKMEVQLNNFAAKVATLEADVAALNKAAQKDAGRQDQPSKPAKLKCDPFPIILKKPSKRLNPEADGTTQDSLVAKRRKKDGRSNVPDAPQPKP
ncbi:hypothetical protein AURDEDRAFT_115617 [Auricularia subglabra TFB-10046 SS5]|nr:hypothetical protein AURDEDRAFT_115617 [Auricularia subglabra TFB-10046 SS5]